MMKQAWFSKRFRWFYLPSTWQGYTVTVALLSYSGWIILHQDPNGPKFWDIYQGGIVDIVFSGVIYYTVAWKTSK